MPLAVFKILFLDYIALTLCCIVGIVSTADMDMEHGVSLPCRKQNITAVVDRYMTALIKFPAKQHDTFLEKHLGRRSALCMGRCFYQFLDLFQCKHFVHLSAFRLRVN